MLQKIDSTQDSSLRILQYKNKLRITTNGTLTNELVT